MTEYWDRPCAATGLISYRCRSRFGWVMIGALNVQDALAEAKRSSSEARIEAIERWNGNRYVPVHVPIGEK